MPTLTAARKRARAQADHDALRLPDFTGIAEGTRGLVATPATR
ncbi:hypothetical protein [Streptosporangium subroseum]|nr:hypothetical protein OHB15_26890 [Streptosporangium subroseum]